VQRVLELVESFADSTSSVLVCGETGTGKELVAKALHRFGGRRDRPFVAVNCAAIPRELIEAELFGYEKGAFTGAVSRRTGRIEQAAGGTLFLDEIGELESAVQAKLLRVLQEKEVEMLGGRREVPVDFRLVSSTNRDLAAEVEAGRFREDLYYRINVVQIDVPPLRNRRTDIPLLVESFLREFCSREKKVLTIPASLQDLLQKCPWPGNVRQLRNVIERAVVLARGRELSKHDFPPELFRGLETARHQASGRTLREVEADAIKATLSQCDGNKSRAARILGMSRKALYKRLREFEGLNP
jgi:two-component system response regulator HydG